MKELSLYILDITMNSVKAGAKNISISLGEYDGIFSFSVEDDGCGMTKEQLERLSDPFFTTRTTRKVGLGVPFLRMLAEQTGGYVEIKSRSEKEYVDHGTELTAVFREDSIDFIPLGKCWERMFLFRYPRCSHGYARASKNSTGKNKII